MIVNAFGDKPLWQRWLGLRDKPGYEWRAIAHSPTVIDWKGINVEVPVSRGKTILGPFKRERQVYRAAKRFLKANSGIGYVVIVRQKVSNEKNRSEETGAQRNSGRTKRVVF
jgi:hypothetical protein